MACDAEQTGPVDTQYRTIDAAMLEDLADGESLVVDVSLPDVAWVFDLDSGAIDFDRVTVMCPNGQQMSMTEWFGAEGRTPAEGSGGQLTLANDPFDFGTLPDSRAQQLQDAGEQQWGFRIQELELDGVRYLACDTDGMYSCDDGMTWF